MKNDEWKASIQQVCDDATQERDRMVKLVREGGRLPVPMASAAELHEQLTRALATLRQLATLPCLTRPEEAAEEVASFGYRRPCKALECGPCVAFRALVAEGRLPWSS